MSNHSSSIGCISQGLRSTLGQIPILKEHSSNIERRNANLDKQQITSNYTCSTIPPKLDNVSMNLEQIVIAPLTNRFPPEGTSVDISIIDERDDLLLSSTTIKSEKIMDEQLKMCQLHDKVLDIVCLVEKTKICCYCALFGNHKDHNFKSEQQLRDELDKKSKQLMEIDDNFQKAKKTLSEDKQLAIIEEIYEQKKSLNLSQIEEQFGQVMKKLNEAKLELQQKVTEEFDASLKSIKEAWKQCELNLTNEKLFQDWKGYGEQVLSSFREVVHTNAIAAFCEAYEQFPWSKGEQLITDVVHKREQFVKTWKAKLLKIDCSKYSLKNAYKFSINLDSSLRETSANSESPVTSIQQFHQVNSFTQALDKSQVFFSEPSDFKNEARHRHSEVIEKNLYSIRESIGASPNRQIRNSHCGMVKKKRESNLDNWNTSTTMNNSRLTINSRATDKTFVSPKSRMTHCRSPRQSATKQDPTRLINHFEKNLAQTILNLSSCQLGEQALLYFLQKAFASHVPVELNLSKNRLTQSTFVKLMPFFLKVQTVNLASTGLNESCLDQLLKVKGNRRLEEVNLLDNNISLHRNRQKVEMLKQVGIKVICQ